MVSPTRKRLRSFSGLAALLVASVVAGWLGAEALARVWIGPPRSQVPPVLLVSSPSWQRDGRAIHYKPSSEMRLAAVIEGRIAYDVTFRTNDFGSVDERDYSTPSRVPVSRRWAFVGDSFTAGVHGGEPWVPALRERVRALGEPLEIYNLGVEGTGFYHFLPALRRAARSLEFDRIAVIFVTHDLARTWWRPLVRGGRIFFCPGEVSDEDCLRLGTTILLMQDPAAAKSGILDQVEASGLSWPARSAVEWLGRHSHAFSLMTAVTHTGGPSRPLRVDLEGWLANFSRWSNSRESVFLHVPERHEAVRDEYDVKVAKTIRAAGFRYAPLLSECEFRRDHYLPDGHLNAAGYAVLADCVGRVLDLL